MNKGKHSRKKLPALSGKAAVLLFSLALILTVTVGGTAAYLISQANPVTNFFIPSGVSCRVDESFDRSTKTNVTIANTGDIEVYIRAAVVVTWKDNENGNVYAGAPVAGQDYSISYNLDDWIPGNDGFYYCKTPVAVGASTPVLIYSCSPVETSTPPGYGLNVEILGSAIQSVPVSVINSKWPAVTASQEHGQLSKAG